MAEIQELRCVVGGCSYALDEIEYTCPKHKEVGTLDILYDYAALRTEVDRDEIGASKLRNCWRYKALLPVAEDSPVSPLAVGWTPLYESPRIADHFGLSRVWLKDDGANPTGSLKDRASALVLARALEAGFKIVSTASTGNAAAALAGLGASLPEIDIVIFVPDSAPEAKIAQLLVYGAIVLLVDGTYDDAFELCMEVCQEPGWYSRNTGVNPFTTEGKKTVALEIAEQLDWQVPDVVAVSVGDGSIISGIYKGFSDLLQLGWINRMPRLLGVQAEGSAVLADAFAGGLTPEAIRRQSVTTIADSIAAELPRDRAKALRAVRETDGAFVTVSDDNLVAAIPNMAQLSGVFAEPAAAASFAGVERALATGLIDPEESVCLVSTGNGLKDIPSARKAVSGGFRVAVDIDPVRTALSAAGVL
ncbi:MAG: threonine synthase [Chloroflexi bacterium]|nr:threonine synthase [Chloroflexota bacterium]